MQEIFLYFSKVGKKCMLNLYYIKGKLNKLMCDLDFYLCSLEIQVLLISYIVYIFQIYEK